MKEADRMRAEIVYKSESELGVWCASDVPAQWPKRGPLSAMWGPRGGSGQWAAGSAVSECYLCMRGARAPLEERAGASSECVCRVCRALLRCLLLGASCSVTI